MSEQQTVAEQGPPMKPEELDAMMTGRAMAAHKELLKRLLGRELEGWIVPEPGHDPYEGVAEHLYQIRNMIRRALPYYFYNGMDGGQDVAMGIVRLMQVSGSLARVLKQGAPKVITVPAVDVTGADSKTVRGGAKVKGAQD